MSTKHMDKAYISNLSRSWPPERQEALLAERVKGWPISVYRDELRPRALRDRDIAKLVQRDALTRPTGRQGQDTIHVATLAVLDFHLPGFRRFIAAMGKRGVKLTAYTEEVTWNLSLASDRCIVIEQFPISRTQAGRAVGLANGAQVSAARRNAASSAACELIKGRWGMNGYTATSLIAETNLSPNTVFKVLGKWKAVRKRLERNAKRTAAKLQEQTL